MTNYELENVIRELTQKVNTLSDRFESLCESNTNLERQLRLTQCQLQQLIAKYDVDDRGKLTKKLRKTCSRTNSAENVEKAKSQDSTVQVKEEDRNSSLYVVSSAKQQNHCIQSPRSVPKESSPTRNTTAQCCLFAAGEFSDAQEQNDTQICPFSTLNTQLVPEIEDKKNQLTINIEPREKEEDQSKSHSPYDPISAALCANKSPLSVPASTKCPIRFLNQHSPDEIAQYLETHKHEIPRSHAICVKRQQKNEQHVKTLDAKYGSLANIIQGLGQKHRPLLQEKDDSPPEDELLSNHRLQTWALNVNIDGNEHEINENVNDREQRFDRQMKDIRVGESPSRPWGISVPVFNSPPEKIPNSPSSSLAEAGNGLPKYHTERNTPVVEVHEILSPYNPQVTSQIKCNHLNKDNDKPLTKQEQPNTQFPPPHTSNPAGKFTSTPPFTEAQAQPRSTFIPKSNVKISEAFQQPQMLFTGPVFIGYSVDQAIAFTQQIK